MDWASTVRLAVPGQTCMVASGHYLATQAGLEILRAGGNAVDAAVAASAVTCVVMPHACGLGGDAFAIGYDTKEKVWALNASGKSPRLATLRSFPVGTPEDEVVSATVPGIVHGWAQLLSRYGTKSLKDLLAPAIAIAEKGFVADRNLSALISSNERKLSKHLYTRKLFFRSGYPIRAGESLTQVDLASTLKRIASQGFEEFYHGKTASELCRYVVSQGGLIRQSDLRVHDSKWQQAVGLTYKNCEILTPPPNSLGILLLVQLNLLADAGLDQLHHNSAVYVDTLVRAKRTAFQAVLPLVGDPDGSSIDVSHILSADFAKSLKGKVLQDSPGLHKEPPNTTCVVTADSNGNAVSLIQSIFHYFGCGAIAGNTGIILNNRMLNFSLRPDEQNTLIGGKRPAHTLCPTLALRNGKPFLVIGTPGAYAQTQTLCQVLNNILVSKMEIQEALEAPRWFDGLDNELLIENRIKQEVVNQLVHIGYKVKLTSAWEPMTGSVEAILLETSGNTRVLHGASDPRRHGCALGW